MSCVIIYPMELSPVPLSDPPENMTGSHIRFLFGLASDGVYICPGRYRPGGSLLHCPSTLTRQSLAVHFCCTVLGVTSTGRYPASCPVKPGLSSPAVFRHLQPRSPVLHLKMLFHYNTVSSKVQAVKFTVFLYIKTTSSDKFPHQRTLCNSFRRKRQKIVQKLKQTLRFQIFCTVTRNLKQKRFRIYFKHRNLIQ